MPARPFWIIFTLCIIVLIEWLVVPKIIDGIISKEIVSAGMTIDDALSSLTDHKGVNLSALPRDHEETLTTDHLQHFRFMAKWRIMYEYEPRNALFYVAGLFFAGILAGFLFASVAFRHLVKFGDRLGQLSTTDKIAIFLGGLIGLMLSMVLLPSIMSVLGLPRSAMAIPVIVIVYLCIMAMMSIKEELKNYFPGMTRAGDLEKAFQKPKILDTNVIIDGRIADICRAGFVEGQIYIPSFVLEELQHIADSSDSLRRARGRRGLDILNQMRKEIDLEIRPGDAVDANNPEEVDARLVKMAKEIDGCIVTNDFNLNKVAELQGVSVLNINELANALKPVVLPGEEMSVSIVKEGNQANQGVAYLDDGTMIVVECAKKHIGEQVDVIVTSVLQTVAGKMLFANLKAVQQEEDDLIDRNVRSYSSFRPRKKTR